MQQQTLVWYYICRPDDKPGTSFDCCIITVKTADEPDFLKDYGHKVICKGRSIMQALQALEQLESNTEDLTF